jgi:hypothetical protein
VVAHWFDNFNDMDATDGSPMTWDPNPHVTIPLISIDGEPFLGDYNATTGDYRFSGQDMQFISTNGVVDDDAEILIADASETTFTAGVSVRTRVQIDQLANAGVVAGGLFPTFVSYFGIYGVDKDGSGSLRSGYGIGRFDPINGIIALADDEMPTDEMGNPLYPLKSPPEFPVDQDVLVQLDVFDPFLSLTVWTAGQPQPSPQVVVGDSSGLPFLSEGTAGLAMSENEYQGLEQGTATYRWAKAAAVRLLDGDMDADGDVDFDDIDDFVLGLNSPPDYEGAVGLAPAVQGDADHDGDLDFDDIGNFVGILGGGRQAGLAVGHIVPEPSAAVLLALGGLVTLVWHRGPLRKGRQVQRFPQNQW